MRGADLAVAQQRFEEQQRCSIDEQRAILTGLSHCLQQTRSQRGAYLRNLTPAIPGKTFSSAIDLGITTAPSLKGSKMRWHSQLSAAEKSKPVAEWLPPYGEADSEMLLPLHTPIDRSAHNNVLVRRATMQTPRAFNDFLGSLCLGYLSLACGDTTCHDRSCRPRSQSSLCLKYHFPYWFVTYAISILIRVRQNSGPEIVLRMPKVRPANSDVFYFACTGNTDGMRYLFQSGLASPDDVEHGTGISALHAGRPRQLEGLN